MAKSKAYDWKEQPAEGGGDVVRRLIGGAGADLKMVSIKAGTKAERHDHPFEQFVQVLEGGGQLECDAGSVELAPGTVLHFPPGAWHSAVFERDTVLVEVNLRPESA